ncbi:DUF2218 domain-containing protein [Aureimonas fodinaquatilis]|uniref:DUF2218 domain-containing protein n=1 Tax=Aureimonas fodinaquatilis TaxID=2565783 RepID=A0A5B0DSI5_9HYPH|nr:DUF2218 domain-containing protein [Aureimonas fodinaquatilis]KAA0969774.1 DUF2218 domain-containing protein [Aureimonas fodinaquatilis]
MTSSRAHILTAHASRYLQQLCKHWAHKFETEHTPTHARIALPLGVAELEANDASLTITVSATGDADLTTMQQVVQSHVERFAFRETLDFSWQ